MADRSTPARNTAPAAAPQADDVRPDDVPAPLTALDWAAALASTLAATATTTPDRLAALAALGDADGIVALLRPMSPAARRDAVNAATTAVAVTMVTDPAGMGNAVAVLTTAAQSATGPAPLAPLTPGDILAALAAVVAVSPAPEKPGSPAGRFHAAAVTLTGAGCQSHDDAVTLLANLGRHLAALGIGTGRTPRTPGQGGGGVAKVTPDRPNLAAVAGPTLYGPSGATATMDAAGNVVARGGAIGASNDTYTSLSAAANAASGPTPSGRPASLNGWLAWRVGAVNGPTADDVSRGAAAAQ